MSRVIKLVFCKNYCSTGLCESGKYCRFAHPVNEADRLAVKADMEEGRKTIVCIRHLSGHKESDGTYTEGCKNGANCEFKHYDITLNCSGIVDVTNRLSKEKTESGDRINIRFCRDFAATGACKAGYYCRFAHPVNEEDRVFLKEAVTVYSGQPEVCIRHLAGTKTGDTFSEGCTRTDCRYKHFDFTLNPSGIISKAESLGRL